MNDRIIALVAFLALFVWLWSTEHENRAERRAQLAASAGAWRECSTTSPILGKWITGHVLPDFVCELPAGFTVSSVPLPDGIPPGRYLVVDSAGIERRIEVTPEQMTAADFQHALPERDFYVKVLDGQHWIFENLHAVERAGEQVPLAPPIADVAANSDESSDVVDAVTWRELLEELSARAERIGAEQWDRLLAYLERQRQIPDDDTAVRGRQFVESMAAQVETWGLRWIARLFPTVPQDHIAFPLASGRSL